MLRKVITLLIIIAFSGCTFASETAALPDAPSQTQITQAREHAFDLQRSQKKAVVVLHDNSRLTGVVTQVNQDHFTLTDRSGSTHELAFAEVHRVQRSGMSTRTKVLIGIGAGIAGVTLAGCAAVQCWRSE